MAKVEWPAADKRSLIGKRIDRIDGPLKATGAAKYSYDINRPGMLWAKVVTSPHPHAEITSIDTSAAEALAGVKGVWRTRLNGSGVAALLELARLLKDLRPRRTRLLLAFFVNEEPPYFQTDDMGSLRYAQMLAERKEPVSAMIALETIGYYSDAPGSQHYPQPFGVLFPDRGNFVAFVGLPGSRSLVAEVMKSFRAHTDFPSIGGVAPGFIPGISWSDHGSFAEYGFPAMMITDTAIFRYPHYHQPTDTPDRLDYERLARVTKGVERIVRGMAE